MNSSTLPPSTGRMWRHLKKKDASLRFDFFSFPIWSLMFPCCVSERIQMIRVAPVRTSSSTNQIHVTPNRRDGGGEGGWGNLKSQGSKDTACPRFPNCFYIDVKLRNVTIKAFTSPHVETCAWAQRSVRWRTRLRMLVGGGEWENRGVKGASQTK